MKNEGCVLFLEISLLSVLLKSWNWIDIESKITLQKKNNREGVGGSQKRDHIL